MSKEGADKKRIFKQPFKDGWEEFKTRYPRYAGKVRAVLADALQRMVQGAFAWLEEVVVKLSYQERMKRAYGLDPLVCEDCGAELWLWYIWHPDYGVIYDEIDQLKAGQYEPPPVAEPLTDRNDPEPVLQWPLFDLPIPFVYV